MNRLYTIKAHASFADGAGEMVNEEFIHFGTEESAKEAAQRIVNDLTARAHDKRCVAGIKVTVFCPVAEFRKLTK